MSKEEKLEKCDCHIKLAYRREHFYRSMKGEVKLYIETSPANMPTSTYQGKNEKGEPTYFMKFQDGVEGWWLGKSELSELERERLRASS